MIKWVKFDKNDKSTWPPILDGCRVSDYVLLRNDEDCYCVGYRSQAEELNYDILDHDFQEMEFDKWTVNNVTHWLQLPKKHEVENEQVGKV